MGLIEEKKKLLSWTESNHIFFLVISQITEKPTKFWNRINKNIQTKIKQINLKHASMNST